MAFMEIMCKVIGKSLRVFVDLSNCASVWYSMHKGNIIYNFSHRITF